MSTQSTINDEVGYLRLRDILQRYLPIARTTFLEKVRKGEFPKPRKLGRSSLWLKSDIERLIREIEAGNHR